MKVRPMCFDAGDAVELDELLEFLGNWLVSDRENLAVPLCRFVGIPDYGIDEFRADVSRLARVLGRNKDEHEFAGDDR